MPFIPPPPSCAARSVQDAGKTTRKLMGFAAGSMGAIEPSTVQYAGAGVGGGRPLRFVQA